MNKIEDLFKDKIIERGGIKLYTKYDACRFVEECYKQTVYILGIDGFYLTDESTEPSIENSIDFSILILKKEEILEMAKEFLESKDDNLLFEIIFEEKE